MIRECSQRSTSAEPRPTDSRAPAERTDSSSTTSTDNSSAYFELGAQAASWAKEMHPNWNFVWQAFSEMTPLQRATFKRGWMSTQTPHLLCMERSLPSSDKTLSLQPSSLYTAGVPEPSGSVSITSSSGTDTVAYIELRADGRCELYAISFSSLRGDIGSTGQTPRCLTTDGSTRPLKYTTAPSSPLPRPTSSRSFWSWFGIGSGRSATPTAGSSTQSTTQLSANSKKNHLTV